MLQPLAFTIFEKSGTLDDRLWALLTVFLDSNLMDSEEHARLMLYFLMETCTSYC